MAEALKLAPCPICGCNPTVDYGLSDAPLPKPFISCPAVWRTETGDDFSCPASADGVDEWNAVVKVATARAQEAVAAALREALKDVQTAADTEIAADRIRALIDAPADAVLTKMLAEAKAEGMREAAGGLDARAKGYDEAHKLARGNEHAVKTATAQTAKELRKQAAAIRARADAIQKEGGA